MLVTQRHHLNTNCEIVWIQCKIQVQRSFTVETYYNPNENVSNVELDASLLEIGQRINSHNIILTRDFNIPNIDRSNNSITSAPFSPARKLLELLEKHGLKQVVGEAVDKEMWKTSCTLSWPKMKQLYKILQWFLVLVTMTWLPLTSTCN